MVISATLIPSLVIAAPILRSADIHATMTSPTSCEVTMELTVDSSYGRDGASASANAPADRSAPPEIEHRIEAGAVTLIDVQGARQAREIRTIGRTQSLVVQPLQPSYEIRYRAEQAEDRRYRCPLWLPTVPTDGISRAIRFSIDLPASVVPGGSMPAMTWAGTRGTTTLGHIPAFVLVPYAAAGETRGWEIAQVMDAAAIVVFAGASAIWVWRRRR